MKTRKTKSQPKKYVSKKEECYKPQPIEHKELYENIENTMAKYINQTKTNEGNNTPFNKADKDYPKNQIIISKTVYPKKVSKKKRKEGKTERR